MSAGPHLMHRASYHNLTRRLGIAAQARFTPAISRNPIRNGYHTITGASRNVIRGRTTHRARRKSRKPERSRDDSHHA